VAADQGLSTPPAPTPARARTPGRRGSVSAFLSSRRWLQVLVLLVLPAVLIVGYIAALSAMLVTGLWTTDSFTGNVVHTYTTANLHAVFTESLYRTVALRTIGVAVLVTVIDAALAFPIAFYMSVVARPFVRRAMVIAVLTPLWASYLVKAYAWRSLLAPNGPLHWLFGSAVPGYGLTATVITLAYLWLPYMVIPVYAGFERLPRSLFEASADLGAGSARTIRSVVVPLVFPAIAAGSIFTFSLTLGDYIAVGVVGGKTQLLANVIYGQLITANNQPLAAALATVPLLAIVVYLLALRRTGALENV
jgi:putative spermidine/putrescine transport system permease protein